MPIVNLTQRDRLLIKAVIGLRYETTPEQLRYVLVKLRELLLSHPRVHQDPVRAVHRVGGSSLDIEVLAYVMTRDWAEFLIVREDILLRIMDLIEQSGAAFAFPSQTLYIGRDCGPDNDKSQAAEAAVRAWLEEGTLPFPDTSPKQAAGIRGSIDFPPTGSQGARRHDAS
jgi:MscS family membrane protein